MEKKKVSDLLTEQKDIGFFEKNIVSNAPLWMAIFANFVVVVADVRAYDVVYHLTGVWWKALLASLACAVPFILWEIAWQYNHTTEGWRKGSLFMAGLAFATSLFLGVADYLQFTGSWTGALLGGIVLVTGIHTIVGFLYYYNDPDVARKRFKAQALGAMQDQEMNAMIAENLLENGENLLTIIEELGSRFDPDEVEKIMNILQGKKVDRPSQPKRSTTMRPVRQYGADTERVDPTRASPKQ